MVRRAAYLAALAYPRLAAGAAVDPALLKALYLREAASVPKPPGN